MSTLLLTARGPVIQDEAQVRSTVTTVQADAPASMAPAAPDVNQFESDPLTEGGLTGHQLASKVTAPEHYAPPAGNANDAAQMFGRVNDAISTSGTAAARESAGQWGHGTLTVTEGIEPVLPDGTRFTEQYFAAGQRNVQDTAGTYMTAAAQVDATRAAAQAAGADAARKAVSDSQYNAFLTAQMGL